MGQRPQSTRPVKDLSHPAFSASDARRLSVFPTPLGWFALWGAATRVAGLLIGHVSADEVRESVRRRLAAEGTAAPLTEGDWFPALRRRLVEYADGCPQDFDDCEIDWPNLTPFQLRVVAAARRVRYGSTATYGELAERAGYPGAARAAGSVMAANRVPIIIPCHRIVAAGGGLGGFSAPRGISLKRQMLDIEAAAAPRDAGTCQAARQNARQKRKKIFESLALTNS